MSDKALRGNKLTAQRRMGRSAPEQEDAQEIIGSIISGGPKGKPHSTKEGRRAAGANLLNRWWGQKYKKKSNTTLIKFRYKKKSRRCSCG